jgi:hypothetical protein
MTAAINFTDLKQKLAILGQLHEEQLKKGEIMPGQLDSAVKLGNPGVRVTSKVDEVDNEEDKRYIALRQEVSRILTPLFNDLSSIDMLQLWHEIPGQPTYTRDVLEFTGVADSEMTDKPDSLNLCYKQF